MTSWESRLRHWRPWVAVGQCLFDDPGVLTWLHDTTSLTKRLKRLSDSFRVEIVHQGWIRPCLDEQIQLGMKTREVAWVRQVRLICNGNASVYARTVIPRKTLQGPAKKLQLLGSRPLGELLFSGVAKRSGSMEFGCLEPAHPLFSLALPGLHDEIKPLWGRRSEFFLHGKPLLLSEFFLPAIHLLSRD